MGTSGSPGDHETLRWGGPWGWGLGERGMPLRAARPHSALHRAALLGWAWEVQLCKDSEVGSGWLWLVFTLRLALLPSI